MPGPETIYCWLTKLYPARFREEYERAMEQQFRDDRRETRGALGAAGFWWRVVRDVAVTAPAERAREFAQDLRYSLRLYRGNAAGPLFAVVALGLAIGASTAVFSVVNAILLRSLPFADAERLVELVRSPVTAGEGREAFHASAAGSSYLESAGAFSASEMNLTGSQGALRVKTAETSANFFSTLGTPAALGRTFAAKEEEPGHTGVAVIRHALWQKWFGGDPGAVGRSMYLNGAAVTVIGVAPVGFDYPAGTDVWIPSVFDFERIPKRGAFLFQTVGRLKAGVSHKQARALFDAEARLAGVSSSQGPAENRPQMVPLRLQLAGPVRQASVLLGAMVAVILLAACANVALWLLSRAADRLRELEVRTALGASRARIVQQLVTESLVLTSAGALLGLLVANWAVTLLAAVMPPQLASQSYRLLDWRVLGFAGSLAIATGLVFGVVPVFGLRRLEPEGGGMRLRVHTPGRESKRLRSALIGLQVALALVLINSSAALVRGFRSLLAADLGLRPESVVTLSVSLESSRHSSAAAQWRYYSEALERLRGLPQVEAAGGISYLPFANNVYMAGSFALDSGPSVAQVVVNAVTPGYFDAIGTPILAGRDFKAGAEPAVIVNEAFARSAGLGTAIIGRRLKTEWSQQPYPIIGVAATTRLAGPGFPGGPQVFWPIEEEPPPRLNFVARSRGPAAAALKACEQALGGLDRAVPVFEAKLLDDRLAGVLSRPAFFTATTTFLAGLATLLAAIGVFGSACYSIAQRRRELGIRLALGATYGRACGLVAGESLRPIVAGAFAGLAIAFAAGRYVEHLVWNAVPLEGWASAGAAAFLVLTGAAAASVAVARVRSIQPAEALRAE